MKPKAVEEMSVMGLAQCAKFSMIDAGILLAQFHTDKDMVKYPLGENKHWQEMKAKERRHNSAVSELARRARAAEKTTTGKDGKR